MEKKVVTVLGRVPDKNLGITDAHNHLWISRQVVEADDAPVLDQQDLIIKELISYRQFGGGAQVDCQPGGAGRDGKKLRQLAKASGVQVISCTGFHLRKYYPEGFKVWQMDADQAADYFLSEIRDGLEETRGTSPVYPGFIKVAVGESLAKSPGPLLEAACNASLESGLLIEMHTEKGSGIEEFVDFTSKMGLAPDRLVICHLDKRPDPGLHRELAGAGYLLEYDTFFRAKYQPEQGVWPLIFNMVKEGFSRSIALATDLADSAMWLNLGRGPGLTGFIRVIKKRLDEEIQDPEAVGQMIGGNIARRLAIL